MLLPLMMLLFLHGTSKPLWAGAECAPLCLRLSVPHSVCGSLLPVSELCRVTANGNHPTAPSLPQGLPDTEVSTLGDGMQPPSRALGMPMMSCRK